MAPSQEDQQTKEGYPAPSLLVMYFPLPGRIPPRGRKAAGIRSELVRGHLNLSSHLVSPLHPHCTVEKSDAKKAAGPVCDCELGLVVPVSSPGLFPTQLAGLSHPRALATMEILGQFYRQEMKTQRGLGTCPVAQLLRVGPRALCPLYHSPGMAKFKSERLGTDLALADTN